MVYYSNCANCSHNEVCCYKHEYETFVARIKEDLDAGSIITKGIIPKYVDLKYCCHNYLLKCECEM